MSAAADLWSDWRSTVPAVPPPNSDPRAQLQWVFSLRCLRWGLAYEIRADTREGREAMERQFRERAALGDRRDPAAAEAAMIAGGGAPRCRPTGRRGGQR